MEWSMTGLPVHHQLPELAQTHFHQVGDANHLIVCHSLLLLPSIFPSISVFSNESVLRIRWQNYWSFSFSISPSNKHSGLISFMIDWFDLLTIQGTLKTPLQNHGSKPWFEGIKSLRHYKSYSPIVTSIHDFQKTHSFDYMEFCWQSNVSAFY